MKLRRAVVWLCLIVATFLLGLGSHAQTKAEKSLKEILSEAGPAVVFIGTQDADGNPLAQGSGFVVDPSGVIVTNFHVIQGAHAVEVKFKTGEVYDSLGVIDYDVRRDIALIRIKAARLPTLKLGDSQKVEQGDRAIAIGNPMGLEHTVSDGLISGLRILEGTRYLQISVPISPGSSGGPLFSMNGEVIGITSAGVVAEGAQNLNLAIPSQYLEVMLDSTEVKSSFPQLAQEYPVQREEEVGRLAESESEAPGEQFVVAHDHGDAFESYCIGILIVTETNVSYKANNSPHSFEMPLEAIQEVKKNALYGADWDAFHIKLKTQTNYNFAHLDEEGNVVASDAVLFAIQQAILKSQQK